MHLVSSLLLVLIFKYSSVINLLKREFLTSNLLHSLSFFLAQTGKIHVPVHSVAFQKYHWVNSMIIHVCFGYYTLLKDYIYLDRNKNLLSSQFSTFVCVDFLWKRRGGGKINTYLLWRRLGTDMNCCLFAESADFDS